MPVVAKLGCPDSLYESESAEDRAVLKADTLFHINFIFNFLGKKSHITKEDYASALHSLVLKHICAEGERDEDEEYGQCTKEKQDEIPLMLKPFGKESKSGYFDYEIVDFYCKGLELLSKNDKISDMKNHFYDVSDRLSDHKDIRHEDFIRVSDQVISDFCHLEETDEQKVAECIYRETNKNKHVADHLFSVGAVYPDFHGLYIAGYQSYESAKYHQTEEL